MDIKKTLSKTKKAKPDPAKLGFGIHFTDHMFIMEYSTEKGWHDPQIMPFGDLTISPAAMVFHYAQELFEGMKAYKSPDGRILLFRPEKNIERMNCSCRRICIPELDENDALQAINELVKVDADWIPDQPGTSLYIRPFIIATDSVIGVHVSHTYKFIVILSPVGSYYATGINPTKIYVEKSYVRAVKGGTGDAKVGGNYAASLIGQQNAAKYGCAQALWLDAVEHKYVDEVGAMNVFFVIGDEVVTPSLDGNILPGITRLSVIEYLRSENYTVTERKISIDEVMNAAADGSLTEMFGTGTAAVISPVGELLMDGKSVLINGGKIGAVSQSLYDTITGIQWGKTEDKFGWSYVIK